eukprot:g16709.t1
MGRELTAVFTSSLVLLLCPSPDAFVPPKLSSSSSSAQHRGCLDRHLSTSRPHRSVRQRASSTHGDRGGEPTPQRPPPPLDPPQSVAFRVLRGGRRNTLGEDCGSGGGGGSDNRPEDDVIEVSLDQGGTDGDGGGGGGSGLANTAESLRDFLFLARSSQPGSIGEELQRRGVRVFPEEAFVDGAEDEGGSGKPHVPQGAKGGASGGEDDLSRFSWVGGTPLPLDTAMTDLPRDEKGRVRLVVWDPCGPGHPLVRAVGGEPGEQASIEVLNFLLDGDETRGGGREEEAGGDRPGSRASGGCTRGYGEDFDESRSAVVFRNWFTAEQQQVIADALAAQMFDEDDEEGPGLAVDREHFPLLRDRAALTAVGDGMLSALSSDRFSGQVGGRAPPVPTRANREFNAVCYGTQAKMQEHRDTWKEWTLIVSIGNTIPFDLGTCSGSPDLRLELASGEGLLFNGYELFHEVHGVKHGTAPAFWEKHALSVKGGFARVGFLSMKSFNTGPRRVSSFSLANDVFRSMSHASSWGSDAGGNMFGFGPASVDGEGEDPVQRLDDASFNDLNFLTMEGVGPSDRPGTPQREPSEAGLDTKPLEKRAAATFEESYGGNSLQAAVPKEETVVNAIVGRAGSARDSLSTASSSRDLLVSSRDILGSTTDMISRKDSGILGSNVFDLEGRLPTFSASMEEYLNRQLEAAEQSLDHAAEDASSAASMGVVGEPGSSPTFGSTPSVVVKSERDRHPAAPGEIPQDSASSEHVRVKGGSSKARVPKRRTRAERNSQKHQQQREQLRQEHGSDEDDGSSHSEYEPPAPRERKVKKGRARGRAVATATRAGKAGGGGPAGARAASLSAAAFRRGSLKRQTSEDVAARLPLEVLECFYHVPLNIAAQQLSVSLTMLKKLCRAYGVKRWPHRQVSSLDKTTSRLEEKIKGRHDDGKEAPSLVRKLTQARKRRSVIIKTASAGLDASVLNSIFTCRPGDIDEDLLLSSTDVAKAVEKIKFSLEADRKDDDPESQSESDDGHDDNDGGDNGDDAGDSDEEEGEEPSAPQEARRASVKQQLSGNPKKKTCVRDVLATPPFAYKSAADVKPVSAPPPPAFEPGGRMKIAAPQRKSDAKPGTAKPGAAKPTVKTERLSTPARRTMKAAGAPSTKCRKGVVAAMAARQQQHSITSAGNNGGASSVPPAPTHGKAAASPGSNISDGSTFDDPAGGAALTAADAMPASSPLVPFGGSSSHRRSPMTGYSGVFGAGLHHESSSSSSSSGRGHASQATAGKKRAGDPFGRSSPVAAHLRGGEDGTHAQQAAQMSAWAEAARAKRAMGHGEWRGGAPSWQSSPLQRQLSDARSGSPTTTATLDSFNLKLSLESPARGSNAPPPPLPPPPPPHQGNPYMLHHHFPHHQQVCFDHINWVSGRYPGQPQQQPHGFPAELVSPVDIHFPHQQHPPGSREFHAFSKADDTSDAGANNNVACTTGDAAEACSSGGEGETEKAEAVAVAEAEAAPVSEDPAPRRTGFMSYLLHQRPQSPPLELESCPSPLAPPTAPSAVDTMDAD